MHNVNIKEEVSKTQAFNVGLPVGGTYRYRFRRRLPRCKAHVAAGFNRPLTPLKKSS